ncbi:hypothetical protein BGX28_003917 [Mortierella sp. GBA30]|nr:hypothetical protein BGX28_003917 [Mortierella sp. GBA30]
MDSISSSTNSLLYARNIEDIDPVSGTRRAVREPLCQLNQLPRLLRLRHAQRLRKKRGKKRIVAHIKHQIKEHALSVHSEQHPSFGAPMTDPTDGWCVSCNVHHRLSSHGHEGGESRLTYSMPCQMTVPKS